MTHTHTHTYTQTHTHHTHTNTHSHTHTHPHTYTHQCTHTPLFSVLLVSCPPVSLSAFLPTGFVAVHPFAPLRGKWWGSGILPTFVLEWLGCLPLCALTCLIAVLYLSLYSSAFCLFSSQPVVLRSLCFPLVRVLVGSSAHRTSGRSPHSTNALKMVGKWNTSHHEGWPASRGVVRRFPLGCPPREWKTPGKDV